MNESGTGLLSIGQFARCCRLSVKALRHYDEQAVLKPAYVDAHTGYRYYLRSQARQAVLIGLLRSLDVPLTKIATLLRADDGAWQSVLAGEEQRLERELAQKRAALDAVRHMLAHGDGGAYDIAVRDEPAYRVAARICETVPERVVADSTRLIYDLFEDLQAAGVGYRDPVMCITEPAVKGRQIRVRACVTLSAHPEGRWPATQLYSLPAGPVAWLSHRGPYETLGIAHYALLAWVQGQGLRSGPAVREIYRNDPSEVAPEDLQTEVLLPLT